MKTSLLLMVPLLLLATPSEGTESSPAFKLYVEHDGVYRVRFEDLDLDGEALPVDGLGLTSSGEPVPVWVEDGGEGLFGPGDWLEFLGEHVPGEHSYGSEHTRYNVYVLRFDHETPSRMERVGGRSCGQSAGTPRMRRAQHLEQNPLMLRLPASKDGSADEPWYWARLFHSQPEPYRVSLELDDLDASAGGRVTLRLQFRGWSKPRRKPDPEMPDHNVEVSLNGAPLSGAEWNGTDPHLLEIPSVSVERVRVGENLLELEVPRRRGREGGDPLVDVVMLNWIEIDYPRDRRVLTDQAPFRLEGAAGDPLQLDAAPGTRLVLYGDGGSRSRPRRWPEDGQPQLFCPPPNESGFVAADPRRLPSPALVVRDRPSRLTATDNRADYIMITHRTLRDAIAPLADLHRTRGLEVMVVDVEDVYDEFSHGVVHPRALRDFVAHAYHRWRPPAPRFVLLVGDASWDARNAVAIDANYADWTYRPNESSGFWKNTSTPYPTDAELNRRGLIPTGSAKIYEGHAASDNYFVAVAGEDAVPDLAIGRLPVVEPEDVTAIVEKTIRYITEPESGAWRRNVLFITNEQVGFQRQSDRLAVKVAGRGLMGQKVYPASSETSNELHTGRLISAFDEGQLFVHFIGHGGRYIWRTGPPDLEKNHDLFTLDHVDQLAPNARLPVVMSLTCYSAPFDHPSADSIGEKLVRVPGRGAIGVLAASWRNFPSARWGETLLAELGTAGTTIGEAVMRAKQAIGNRMFTETYNLLGDPAVPVALPAGEIHLVSSMSGAGQLDVTGDAGFAGALTLDLVDAAGDRLRRVERTTDAREFSVSIPLSGEEQSALGAVSAYLRNGQADTDAAGGQTLEGPPAKARSRPNRSESTARTTDRPRLRAADTPSDPRETERSAPPGPPPAAKKSYSNTVRWATASELNNFGFDVLRAESPDGPFERINQETIQGAGTTDEPSRYKFVDRNIDPHKDYYYYVESISMSGVRKRLTPVGKAPAKAAAAEEEAPQEGDPGR